MSTNSMNLIGRTLGGRFKVIKVLNGGMGILFVVEDIVQKRNGIIKTIKQDDEILRKRFIEELKATSLIRSPFVVETYDVLTGASLFELPDENKFVRFGPYSEAMKIVNDFYLYMEYCNGGDLRTRLTLSPSIQVEEGLIYAIQFVCGMLECQKTFPGLVHRDIKPENILFNDGVLKISDFGLIRQTSADDFFNQLNKKTTIKDMQTNWGGLIGTIPYMSPEQIQSNVELDIRSDIFSYGVVLHEIFTGMRPYTGDFAEFKQKLLSEDNIPSVAETQPDLDKRVSKVIDYCLKKKPFERPSSWAEILNIWLEFIQPTITKNTGQSHTSDNKIVLPNDNLYLSLSRDKSSYLDENYRNGSISIRINQKPLNSLRKAKDLFNLDKNEDALEVIDDALGLSSQTDKLRMQNHLTFLLKTKEEQMIKMSDEDGSGDVSYQLNIGPLIEEFMDLRGKCYTSLLDVVNQGGKRANENIKKAAVMNAELMTNLFPSNAQMFILAAQTFLCIDIFDTALLNIENAKRLAPNSDLVLIMTNEIWTRKGMFHVQSGDFQQALTCFDKLIAIDSSDARAWFNKGIVLMQSGDNETALEVLKQANELGHPGARQAIKAILGGEKVVAKMGVKPTEDSIELAIQAFVKATSFEDMKAATEVYPFMVDIEFLGLLTELIEQSPNEARMGLIERLDTLIGLATRKGTQ